MKKISTLLLSLILVVNLCACSDKSNNQDKGKLYSNEFFMMSYPSDYMIEEKFNNMFDTIPSLSKGIRVILRKGNHTIAVQKSAMFEIFETTEEWRDVSVSFSQLHDDYLGTIDSMMLDSLEFGPYPAAMAGFAVVEGNDTLINKQLIVLVGKTLYYLNNTYPIDDDGTLQKYGDSILNSVRFIEKKND